jgi:ATP-dependent Clp protease protease subunit
MAAREDLEIRKLEAEVAKLTAEADHLSVQAAEAWTTREWRLSRPENAGDGLELLFADRVDDETVQQAVLTLNTWARRWPGAGITLVLNSPGGSVIDGLALYDYVRSLSARGHHITTRVIGWAASMGGVLLQAGDTREMGSNSFVLIHEVTTATSGKSSSVEDNLKFTQRLQEKILRILAARSTMDAGELGERWLRRDWWLDADETVELGFADRVF